MVEKRDDTAPAILENYRPLAIRAVAAACVIRPQPSPPPQPDEPVYAASDLPPGFHMPQSVWDD